MADEELKKAFQDLQFKTNETKALIAQGEVTKKLNAQKQRMSELSAASIAEVPSDLSVYRSVGRMFLLTTKDSEIERHNAEALEYKQKIDAFAKQKEYLQRGLEEAERNLREMVQARRA
ncbi:prefoldin subunit [Oesophagostomum dentatum]|uniref:Prefoldin subunit n=1 Tax=Oesophagostomum dentatum TaxID=61180 RepID=A0A0B1TTL6_OESDE|nr:prefoldin subunit [Oesophagostomum dentatum]